MGELGPDVVGYISHATQTRLQNLLERVTHVATLKNQSLKVRVAGGNGSHPGVSLTRPPPTPPPPPGGRAARAGERRPHAAQVPGAAGSAGEAEEGGAGEGGPAEGCQGNPATGGGQGLCSQVRVVSGGGGGGGVDL